ncbi:PREDICTED: uncharacterized protein KIAA1551 homolog [Gekko japonicus]|uniref:Uncharacterized protein KIAA1551 homolog n=1 Tax=Gekko japonicus TaxID=146911 RepID=A0ABM1K6Q1_GEKJA|nr:PREDICTED: uncharacterized protein KIAA1551 homolog [Gekko japonicus]XP_015269389.1 PREDICTED: uncharacterized protein KIAA1551 homolog [Gekko japonicus]XP_015269390.1 PREDICTED: uncharacterized protein KIAA1551 homolog [Gekko japonicus]
MDWTVRPHHATNLKGRDFQVQGLYQSQQVASGFSQASASIQNSSAYVGNVQAMKIHSSTENMVPNQVSSQNNVGSNNFQPPLLKSSVPVTGFGTVQRFVGQHPDIRVSNMTGQMTSGMAKNTWPNSNLHIISHVAPQFSTANPVQRPANQYITSDMYNNQPQKNGSNSIQNSVYWGNINSLCSKRLPMIVPKHRPANPQTHATVPLNQVSSHFVNSQQNSSYLTFSSGQNIQNQINDINSGSATAMQSQQYASNCAYSLPYTIPTNHYAAQVIPQATDTNPPPPYAVLPIQINHGQFVLPQPVPNSSNENVQNSQNLALDQSSISYSVQNLQTPQSAPISRETNEKGGAADSIHGHSAENQPFDELTKSTVEALKGLCDSLQIPGTVPLDKTSTPQASRSMVEDYTDKSSGNALDSLTKFRESLTLDMRNILAMRNKLLNLQGQFKLKQQLFRSVAQKSKASDPSVHNPDLLFPKSNASPQTAPLPQATQPTFSPLSHNAAQNPTSLLPHDSAQNQAPLLACSSSQIQDRSLLPLKKRNYSKPILQGLLKGTFDEEMLLNTLVVASTEKNQSKQLFPQEMCFSGSVLDSSDVKSKTCVNDMKRASRLSPKTSQTVSTQGSLTSTNVNLGFEQISALGKDQLTNMSAMSGGGNGFVLNKDKVGTTVTKILTDPQSTVSVQNPAESSQLSEKLAKEGTKNSQNPRSEFIQQNKYHCFQTTEKSITACNNQNYIPSSASLIAAVPEARIVQRSSFTGNSCTMGKTCSLEELETSLALWRKSPAASLNDQLGGSTKPTMHSSSLDGVEDKEMKYTMKNFPNALTHYEKSSITVEKNEPILSSVSSSLGQKLDAVSSSSSKSSEPQVAIVPPLILSKEEIWNEVQEKSLSSVLEKTYPVISEGSVHSLHEFVLTSDTDKLVKTAGSPSDSCVTVKEIESDMYQKPVKCTKENGIQSAESGTACYCNQNQRLTGSLELEKNTSQLYSRNSFPPGTNKDNSSPVSQKCPPKGNPDLVEQEGTVLNENMLQISSVCTLVQGDALYNSQIANIFNTSSKAEHNISSENQGPDSYHAEPQLSHLRRESGMNGSTSVGDVLLPSLCTLSKTIAEKLLSLPGLKMPKGGKVSDEVNVRESEEEKNTELINRNSGKVSEQNMSCNDVHSKDLASGNQEVLGNSIPDESTTHSIQDDVPSDENQVHSVNNIDIALTLLNDQLTELLQEFPYGIDSSKALKNTENEDSATKINELKDGQEIQTCGQNSEAGPSELDQIKITILNSQEMKELFPECRSQSSNKLENRENDELVIASENTNKSHIHTTLVESTNTSTETVQEPAGHSFCCIPAWLALKYAVEPCKHMLAKEAALKQQLVQYLPSEIMIKEGLETETSSTDCQLNNQQQTPCPISNNFPSEVESNRILSKTYAGRESDLQEKECKPLKDDNGLTPRPFLGKLEPQKPKNKEQGIEVLEKVQIDGLWKQKCTLVSQSQEQLYSVRDYSKRESIRSACERELSVKKRTSRETVVDKSKSNTLLRRRMENKHSKKEYKIKRDSSETHIIKGPTRTFKRGLKKHIASEGKQKTKERPCSIVTDFSNLSNVDLVSKVDNNAQHSREHVNRQKCKIESNLENNKTVRMEHRDSNNSEPVEQNKGSLVRTNLKKFAYPEERGNIWKYRRLLSNTSKLQTFRGQLLNMNKALSSSKRGAYKRDKCFVKTLSDKKSPCGKKINTLTLQREQKKNYLNKVAFKQMDQSICLTELEQSPSKSAWYVKPSNASEHPENKNYILSSQQSEAVKPQMLEFKMCPEIVFRNLVSEDVSDAKKLPEKEIIPVSAVKSRREDWLNYIPQKRRKTDEKEIQVDDRIPLDTAMELLEKNEVIRSSNATFETFRKMHLEKSRSLDSSPIN